MNEPLLFRQGGFVHKTKLVIESDFGRTPPSPVFRLQI
ncbi:hypothetical protein MELB17_16488 [Marinobacter sp. ELB17]|nr:hypothetical protein MELB17_16488 [Marinobacter sp. ELB17]